MGNYDYDRIAILAIKRYVEGYNTIDLLEAATSQREKEEVVLVALLHFDDEVLDDFNLGCACDDECKTIIYRNRLKNMLRGYLENSHYH
jgi:hypothetical protein